MGIAFLFSSYAHNSSDPRERLSLNSRPEIVKLFRVYRQITKGSRIRIAAKKKEPPTPQLNAQNLCRSNNDRDEPQRFAQDGKLP
jgi:hypothetical protein